MVFGLQKLLNCKSLGLERVYWEVSLYSFTFDVSVAAVLRSAGLSAHLI